MDQTGVFFVEDIEGDDARTQYETILAAVRLREDPPDGLILHVAGPSATGWRIVAVWESRDALVRFRDDRLLPTVSRLGPQACESRIEVTAIAAHVGPSQVSLG